MRLLLDTHTLLWFCEGNTSISQTAKTAIEDEANERYVSHVSAWEVAIKLSLGKINLQVPYQDLFPGVIAANQFLMLLPEFRNYCTLIDLPFHHRDPFDRLLIAQAKTDGMVLVTNDGNLGAYGLSLLW